MRRRHSIQFALTQGSLLATAIVAALAVSEARAVDPNPLQNAYWRFEEGTAGATVSAPATDTDPVVENSVLDSSNANHLRAWRNFSAPTYVTNVAPTPLKSGLDNNLALEFIDISAGQDLFTVNKDINNGIIAPGGGFTLEAAFNVYDTSIFRTIVAKEIGTERLGEGIEQNLPTLALKTRGALVEGDPDAGKLAIELFDGAGQAKSIMSTEPLELGQWYYAAVVNDGSTLSLYLDSNDSNGYVLQGQTEVDGALFQGLDPEDPDWNYNWTVGRGQYNGGPTDFFLGIIDEVRLSNTPLSPSQFLFAAPGLPGDFNGDDRVDGNDFLVWQRGFGSEYDATHLADWKSNFGQSAGVSAIPEPTTLCLAGAALVSVAVLHRRQRSGPAHRAG